MPAVPPAASKPPDRDLFASLPRPDRHRPRCGPVRPSRAGRRRAWVLIGVHVAIGLHFLHWGLTGSSLTPLEPSEAMQTFELGKINAGFLLFAAAIATTLIFGRWFCGWACHVVALQDLCAWLLGRLGLRPRPVRSRLLVLAPWVVAGHMFLWPHVAHWIDPVVKPMPALEDWHLELTSADLWATFPKWIMGPATLLVVGFLIVWWLGAKGFCSYGCPYGALFAVADRFAPVRIVVSDACDACGHCTSVCSSNVRVHEEVAKHRQIVDPGCMKCLDCVSVCPKDALRVGVAAPKPFVSSQQRLRARADFTWLEELALAAIALVACQWTFRGAWFGEGVPFLLAVGLGVITAVFAVLGWRLLRRPEVTFQYAALKAGGRWTRSGRWVFVAIAVWLAFAVHTFVAQRWKAAAVEVVTGVAANASAAQLGEALAAADRALALDLIDDPDVGELRGLVLRRLGRHVEAEAALRRSLDQKGGLRFVEAELSLASYCLDPARRRYDEAERLLRRVLAQYPDHPAARQMLEHLQAQRR